MRSLVVVLLFCPVAWGESTESIIFGSGADRFSIEFVAIGDLGNPPDVRTDPPMGAVDYGYQIAKCETSCEMTRAAGLADFQDKCMKLGEANPAHMSWNHTARFVNWLNTSSGFPPAYKLHVDGRDVPRWWEPSEPGYHPQHPIRNSRAKFVLPDLHEWHKAAYFDPVTQTYNRWATGNREPTRIGPEGGTAPHTAVFNPDRGIAFLADVTKAGGLSAYGAMGQTGNQGEWEEGPFVLDFPQGTRAKRIGADSTVRASQLAADKSRQTDVSGLSGFRVVALSQPDPLPGDTNADGLVDLDDFLQLAEHFGEPGTYADGDFARDGIVRFDDFLILSHQFHGRAETQMRVVPEPAGFPLACLALVVVAMRRNR